MNQAALSPPTHTTQAQSKLRDKRTHTSHPRRARTWGMQFPIDQAGTIEQLEWAVKWERQDPGSRQAVRPADDAGECCVGCLDLVPLLRVPLPRLVCWTATLLWWCG